MPTGSTVSTNRRARFDYEVLDTIEAGLVLTGTEIKAIREGHANLAHAYARPEKGELWLLGTHIAEYSHNTTGDQDPIRPRKLLLHREQIRKLTKQVAERGLTIVPLRLYLKRHLAKVELGVAKGRKRHDKRRLIVDRDREREARDAIRR